MKYIIPIIILSLVLLGCKADEEEETLTAGIARYPYPEDVKLINKNLLK